MDAKRLYPVNAKLSDEEAGLLEVLLGELVLLDVDVDGHQPVLDTHPFEHEPEQQRRVTDVGPELHDAVDHVAHHESLQEEMLESGISLMEIAEGEDCVEALSGFFQSRQRRVADETGG